MMKMKNDIWYTLHRGAVALLAAAVLLSCSREEFVREAGTMPGEEALTGIGFLLDRPGKVDGRVLLVYDDVTDILRCRLSRPAAQQVTLQVAAAPELVARYNRDNSTDFEAFPADKVTFDYDAQIPAQAVESGPIQVVFQREGVTKGRYLMPVVTRMLDKENIFYYDITVLEATPESELDEALSFKVVGYINTEEMNPLYGIQFSLFVANFLDFTVPPAVNTWLDIEILRKSSLTINPASGTAKLEIAPDLQYVLNSRTQYINPIQRTGRKVLFCVNGGSRSGFCCLNDEQIADMAYQIHSVITKYDLDGVNFYDTESTYGQDGLPSVIPGSYAKLIKATKEALGGKLVTVACDVQSTSLLAVAHDGIEAGQFLDYAWPAIRDKVVDAYSSDSELKPIAGLDRSKYGSLMLETHDVGWKNENKAPLVASIKSLYYDNRQSANIFAFWDMQASRAGIEKGAAEAFVMVTEGITNIPVNGMLYDIQLSSEVRSEYGKFKKDW